MRIIFVVGSYRPQKCGVTDYSLQLIDAASARGHEACIVAVNDVGAVSPCRSSDGMAAIIPSQATCLEKRRFFQQEIDRFSPDHISIQFVPYAMERRRSLLQLGVPWETTRVLSGSLRGCNTSLMLHEIWTGWHPGSRRRATMLGRVQASALDRFIKQLEPKCLATNAVGHRHLLSKLGHDAQVLPVFSNIAAAGSVASDNASFSAVHFGALKSDRELPGKPSGSMLAVLADIAMEGERRGVTPIVRLLGRQPSRALGVWNEWQRRFEGSIDFCVDGELPATQISQLLAASRVGLCSTPRCLIGKSGGAAAMAAHGLHVIAPYEYALQSGQEADREEWVCADIRELNGRSSSGVRLCRPTPAQVLDALT